MFDNFFSYIPILFGFIILCGLLNKAWNKRDLIKGIYKNSKNKYKLDSKKATKTIRINYKPIIVNLFFLGYNLKLFFTDFSNEIDVFLNFWVSFFLLLLNIPLFIYKDNGIKSSKKVAIFMFFSISLFCFPVLFIKQSTSIIILFVGWLLNYTILIFDNNEKAVDYLKGQTGFFIIFWVLILLVSLVIDTNFSLPQKYNYCYLINTIYFLTFAYFNYFSNKYENL